MTRLAFINSIMSREGITAKTADEIANRLWGGAFDPALERTIPYLVTTLRDMSTFLVVSPDRATICRVIASRLAAEEHVYWFKLSNRSNAYQHAFYMDLASWRSRSLTGKRTLCHTIFRDTKLSPFSTPTGDLNVLVRCPRCNERAEREPVLVTAIVKSRPPKRNDDQGARP